MPRKRSPKTKIVVPNEPKPTPGQITISPGRTPVNTEGLMSTPPKPVPLAPAPLTEEQAIFRRIKLGFLGMIEKCSHVIFITLPYLLTVLAGHFINELYSFLGQETLEKLPELRYYGNMVEAGLFVIGGVGIVLHNVFDMLTQVKVEYDLYKKGGK